MGGLHGMPWNSEGEDGLPLYFSLLLTGKTDTGVRIQCGCRHGTDDTLSPKGRVFKDHCFPHSSRDGRGGEINNNEDLHK